MTEKMHQKVNITWVGQVEYREAWERQKALVASQLVASQTDSLESPSEFLLLEHPPTYTLGRSGHIENLLLDEAALARSGIALHRVDRGGDITYHGPGQLVGYPILNLKRVYAGYGLARVRRYISDIEDLIIHALARFDISGGRLEGHRGVWVNLPTGSHKIAAVGVRINAGGISSHGFALNVNPNLDHFSGIIPCGIREHGVTSMTAVLGRPIAIADVLPALVDAFATVFRVETSSITYEQPLPLAAA